MFFIPFIFLNLNKILMRKFLYFYSIFITFSDIIQLMDLLSVVHVIKE